MGSCLRVESSVAVDVAAAADAAVHNVEPIFPGVATHAAGGRRDAAHALSDDFGSWSQHVRTVAFGFDAERHFAVLE